MKNLLDEINKIEREIKDSPKQDEDLLEEIYEFLIFSSLLGTEDGNDMIGSNIVATPSEIQRELDKTYDGKTWKDSAKEYLESKDYNSLDMVIETTSHRLYNGAIFNVGKESGKVVGKEWVTLQDDRVRETHEYLEGQVVPLDQEFATIDGDTAKYPGDFELAQNNCNCRCSIRLVEMSA